MAGEEHEHWYFNYPKGLDEILSFTVEKVGLVGLEVIGECWCF
ncbi:MAG: hypothetical protein ACOCRO_08720 [Halanaerobiales bacterium]